MLRSITFEFTLILIRREMKIIIPQILQDTTERLAARGVLAIGVCTLLLGTYVNLGEHLSMQLMPTFW